MNDLYVCVIYKTADAFIDAISSCSVDVTWVEDVTQNMYVCIADNILVKRKTSNHIFPKDVDGNAIYTVRL